MTRDQRSHRAPAFTPALLLAVMLLCGVPASALASRRSARVAGAQTTIQSARPDSTLADALAALENNDLARARSLLEQLSIANPKNAAAQTYLGVIADREGDLERAERHFARAVSLSPNDAGAHNNYGAILLRRGQRAQAAAQFARALRRDPDNLNALINSAQIRFDLNTLDDVQAAREMFLRAHKINPQPALARALVIASLRLGDRPTAANFYRDYASLSLSDINSGDNTFAAHVDLGRALLEGELPAEAVEELNRALKLDPANVDALVALARAHLNREDIFAAGRTLEAAVAGGADDARLYAALVEVYERAGRYENAIPAMRLALARAPKSEAYHFRYGMLLTDAKAPAAAIIRLEESLKEFPRSSRLLLALGIAQQAHGKNVEAAESFRRALELDSQFAPALAYLGAAHDERGEYGEAVMLYERAIKIDERALPPYYLAAEALLKTNTDDLTRVEKYLQNAVRLDSRFAPARVALGKLLLRTDRAALAIVQLEEAVRLDPTFAQAHYQLGRALQRLKRHDEAQKSLNAFKRLDDEQKKESENKRRELVRRMANVRF